MVTEQDKEYMCTIHIAMDINEQSTLVMVYSDYNVYVCMYTMSLKCVIKARLLIIWNRLLVIRLYQSQTSPRMPAVSGCGSTVSPLPGMVGIFDRMAIYIPKL